MALNTWWLFVAATFLICATPGPNMLHVTVQSVRQGVRRSLPAMAGLMSAVLLCLFASALGVGALLRASPALFDVLRYGGAAYLIWLGIKAWRVRPNGGAQTAVAPDQQGPGTQYLVGFGTGMSNPKLILFATAFFPQFLDRQHALAPQLAILIASFAAIEGFWYTMYALGGRSLAAWLARPGRQRMFDRAAGTMFIGFGAALLVARV